MRATPSATSIEILLQLEAAALRREREAGREAAVEAARRRGLLLMAGFAASDCERAAVDPDGRALAPSLRVAVAAFLAAALAGQRRLARRRDARYDLSRHILLARWDRALSGEDDAPGDAPDMARLPGRVANRSRHRRPPPRRDRERTG
ncbi:hypothetical protein [Aurantimonas sp. Leaf443]|uniref:hypothetical protein n=1 Tax=Aurantimonas sp. Leaf443 TaxID=1736378 RepID=UPI0006F31C7F|nr:hypothetical protein [Aurantimonas sp. Leaf443]KQT88213.1 hypothetical protein ASG48_01905 [Aurantimonas sp. Leaf443]